ncbi:hypothetical protein M501DRAFT_1006904 [Patellaria atrata CBS 101060]|uniref:Cytochrome P450 n=1 Tax=Patellaria atrata CBS 101060 TaxID=1346257 RepID=A0A9P4VMS9_9PEZI|nr:hypothetical protein M501DRAFT_1006904 [Patellaria atrata CBS 101060]
MDLQLMLYDMFCRVDLCNTTLPVGGGPKQDQPSYVAKGTWANMSYFAFHHDPAVFGSDWKYMPFGGGQRTCLGQQKVLAKAAHVIARLTSIIESLESRDEKEWKGELKLTCKSANGCKVALS